MRLPSRPALSYGADSFHKPGFKLHAKILHHLFTIVNSGVIKAPLWDEAAKGPTAYPNNAVFVHEFVSDLLSRSFPNLRPAQLQVRRTTLTVLNAVQVKAACITSATLLAFDLLVEPVWSGREKACRPFVRYHFFFEARVLSRRAPCLSWLCLPLHLLLFCWPVACLLIACNSLSRLQLPPVMCFSRLFAAIQVLCLQSCIGRRKTV